MDISRELAIKILKYLDQHRDFYFPFLVVNKEYVKNNDNFIEMEPREWKTIAEDEKYQTFQLWENLQNLDDLTIRLMAKGFIEKINNESLESHIRELIKNYKWKSKQKTLGEKISDYGLCEFIDGKAEAYEDCLRLIRDYHDQILESK